MDPAKKEKKGLASNLRLQKEKKRKKRKEKKKRKKEPKSLT